MKLKSYIWFGLAIILLVGLFFLVKSQFFGDREIDLGNGGVDTLFLKIVLKEGGLAKSLIKVSDYDPERFTITAEGEARNFLSFDVIESTPDDDKSVEIIIDGAGHTPEIYLGNLLVDSSGKKSVIPVIVEVQSKEVNFLGRIETFFSEGALPSQNLRAEIKVYDIGEVGGRSLNLTYFVKDFDGKVLENTFNTMRVYSEQPVPIELPNNMALGSYVLGAIIDDEGNISTSTHFFQIAEKEEEEILYDENLMWIIAIFGILFVFFIILFVYSIISRDRLFMELEKQHKNEIRKIRESIGGSGRIRPVAVKEKIKVANKIYRKRVVVFKKLKSQNKRSEMKKKLVGWKRQGYNLKELEIKNTKSKKISPKTKSKKFKKQGYKL